MPRRKKNNKCDSFVLDFVAARTWDSTSWDKLPNWGIFAVEDPRPSRMARRLFTAKGVEELRENLEVWAKSNMLPDPTHVYILTAACEEDFPDRVGEEILRAVVFGIERLKERKDRQALREIRNALERKGKRPGVVAKPEKHRWLIDVLAELASGRLLKQCRLPRPWKPRSASARLSSFCWKFYQHCVLFGAESRVSWTEPQIAELFAQRFAFQFLDEKNSEHDLIAAEEAYRRGKGQLPPVDWPDVRLIGFRQLN